MSAEKYSSYDVLNAFFDDGSFNETDAYLKSEGGEAEAVTRRRDEQGAGKENHKAV